MYTYGTVLQSIHGSTSATAQFLNSFAKAQGVKTSSSSTMRAGLNRQGSFTVLDQSGVKAEQQSMQELVAKMLSISTDLAFSILVKFSWDKDAVAEAAGRLGELQW